MKIAILGGCGGVGAALDPMLRKEGHEVRSIDSNLDRVHQCKDAEWSEVTLGEDGAGKLSLDTVCEDGAEAIVDLSLLDKVEVIKAADEKGVSIINSTMLGPEQYTGDYLYYLAGCWSIPKKLKAVHIASCGMNPGNVNTFARLLINRHGGENPDKVWFWEYESAKRQQGNEAFITWSPHEFHSEVVEDCGWLADGKSIQLQNARPYRNPYRVDAVAGDVAMEKSGTPKDALGWLVPHEEVLSTAWAFDTQCGYIYGLADENRKALEIMLEQDGPLPEYLASNDGLSGSDRVGVTVYWENEQRSMWMEMPHDAKGIPVGSNATDWLVALAVRQAVRALAKGSLSGIVRPDETDAETWVKGISDNDVTNSVKIGEV